MRINKSLITFTPTSGSGSGTVTSVALSAPTGFVVTGSPITSSGTLAITFASGYALPTTTKQGQWDTSYNRSLTAIGVSGTTTKTITLTKQDATTLTANFTDTITSVFGRTGAIVAVSGDYTTTLVTEGTNLYYTEARVNANANVAANTAARHNAVTLGTANGLSLSTQVLSLGLSSNSTTGALSSTDWLAFSSKQPAITLTTSGSSGSSTLIGATLNVPTYTLVGLGGMSNPFSAAIGQLIYSNSAGAPLSLAPNTTVTKKYLSMTGDGTNGAAPIWDTLPSSISGSGTTNYVARFTPNGTTLGNSSIYDDGSSVAIGITTFGGRLTVNAPTTGVSLYVTDSVNSTFYITHPSTGRTSFYNGSTTRWLTESGGNLGLEGSVIVGGVTPNAKFQVSGGGLAIAGTGFMVSSQLTNGRLETYDAGSCQAIHTYFDAHSYELSAGSTAGYVSGLVVTGRGATLLPDRVAIYTRSVQRFQVGGLGQLSLNAYTSATSFTGTPVAYLAFDTSGNIITSNPTSAGRNTRITFSAEVPNTWLAMPAALSFFDSSTGYVTQADLTAYNQVRLIVNKQGTAGAASSKIILRYQLTSGAPFTASSYSDIGTSEVSVAVNVTNNILITSWIDMATAAKDDVWITILGIDGDGTVSPQFGNIYAEFRFN